MQKWKVLSLSLPLLLPLLSLLWGIVVVQWLALSPYSNKVTGSNVYWFYYDTHIQIQKAAEHLFGTNRNP